MRKLIYPRGKIFGIVDIHFGKRQSVGRIHMNLSILLTDFIDTKGMLKTYRFIPINQYNRIVVDRLSDICTDVKCSLQGTTQSRYLTGGVPPVRFSM